MTTEAKAKALAEEVGDSLHTFLNVVKRQMDELKFNGLEFSRCHITFQVDSDIICVIEIWSTVDSTITTPIGEAKEDSRYFHMTGSDAVEKTFLLIELWKLNLIKTHADKIKRIENKPLTLFV